jgi:hypothetical protein
LQFILFSGTPFKSIEVVAMSRIFWVQFNQFQGNPRCVII